MPSKNHLAILTLCFLTGCTGANEGNGKFATKLLHSSAIVRVQGPVLESESQVTESTFPLPNGLRAYKSSHWHGEGDTETSFFVSWEHIGQCELGDVYVFQTAKGGAEVPRDTQAIVFDGAQVVVYEEGDWRVSIALPE